MNARLALEQVPMAGIDRDEIVSAAAFSPDGGFLATGGRDGVVRLWDAAGSRLIRSLEAGDGHDVRVLAVAFGGGRRMVLAASTDDGRVVTWSPGGGERLGMFATGERYVHSIAVDRQGGLLAAGVGDTVRLWDPTTGRPVRHLTGHRGQVHDVAFNAGGDLLASAGMDGIRLWNPSTGELVRTFTGNLASLTTVAFDPGGDRLAGTGATAGGVRIWHTRTGQELAVVDSHGATPKTVAFSPDGRLLALGSPSRSLRLCDTTTGREVCSLTGRRMGVVSAALFSPDGTEVLAVAHHARHRLPPGSFDRSFGRWRIREIDVEPAGVDSVPAAEKGILRHPSPVHSMAFSPDGSRLVTNNGTVRVWRLDGDENAATVGNANALADVAWSPDGAVLAFTRGLTTVVLVDPESRREVRHWDCGMIGVWSLAFSADGGRLAAALGDHSIVIWDTSTGRTLQRLTAPPSTSSTGPSAMTFSPDGSQLAKGADDGTYAVHLWHLETGRLRQLHGHTGYVVAVAFDPSGARIASGGLDRSVVLWDAATGDELGELTEHTSSLRTVAFSSDGTRLATADSAGTVDVRDPVTGAPTRRLTDYAGPITSIAISPDGARLATAGSDATVRLWALPAGG